MPRHSRILLILTGVLALLNACAGAPELRRSGFLDDYTKLAPPEGRKDLRVYRSPDLDFEKFNALLVEDAVAWFDPDSEATDILPIERKRLTDEFSAIVRKTLKARGYNLVDAPGERVLRVRIAITELYVRFGPLATEGDKKGRIKLDGATLEADLKESLTGRTLFAVMTGRRGGVAAMSGKPTEAVFQYWADQLADLLEESR